MRLFVFRNFTVENVFSSLDVDFSGYGDIQSIPEGFDAYVWFYLPLINPSPVEQYSEIQDYQSRLRILLSRIKKGTAFYILTMASNFHFKTSNSDFRVEKAVNQYNNALFDLSEEHPNVKVFSIDEFLSEAKSEFIDWRFYYISQSLINPRLNDSFKHWFLSKVNATKGARKKCLVLDLDNTLWGGILGEDGISGVQIGGSYPGNAYYDFQKGILELYRSGVILAICSKNNEDEVMEMLEKHPLQLIRKIHLAAFRINWKDKPSNIREIANELNIGVDSMVFIDDSPVERERVRMELPMMTVMDFPSKPYHFPSFLVRLYREHFQIHTLTDEDLNKANQYATNIERKSHESSYANIEDYLSSLEIRLKILPADKFTIPRIAQLTQKTNQFNLTTKRYSEEDIWRFIEQGCIVNCLSVSDRFGDNGITAAAIIIPNQSVAYLDTYLLSCRILGRGIENAYIQYLMNELRKSGFSRLNTQYVHTLKNRQTENFFDSLGFHPMNASDLIEKSYEMPLDDEIIIKSYYNFEI